MKSRYRRMDDERLAGLVGAGDGCAFEALYDRHHGPLLAFCRHMLGSREDGEDALQQAFLRAHQALAGGRAPDRVRPWLFAIARNRCLTLIAARREAALPADDIEPSFDGLAADVERRADLRELVSDLGRLPADQREALVLAELGDLSHPDIARVIGCSPAKVKALVFQARTILISERDARRTPCDEIRTLLDTARGGLLRRGALRRHLRQCDPCAAYRVAIERQRTGFALVLPVAPTAGLKAAVLAGAGGLGAGGAETAAAAAAALAPGALAAPGGGVAGSAVAAGGVAVKSLVAKTAVVVAIAAGGGAAVHDVAREEPDAPAAVASANERVSAGESAVSAGESAGSAVPATGPAVSAAEPRRAGEPVSPVVEGDPAAPSGETVTAGNRRKRLRRAVAALPDGDPAIARRVRRRLRTADPAIARRVRRRLIRARRRSGADLTVGAFIELRRARRTDREDPAVTVPPAPTPTPTPTAEQAPAAEPDPTSTGEPAPTAEPDLSAAATPEPTPTP